MTNKPPNKPVTTDASNARNEYIPSFIAAKPFYASDLLDDTDYLQHQRNNAAPKDPLATAQWYSRTKAGPAATKYRKGACENCGAATHKTKDCLSRKRKLGARWTGKDIQADERVEKIELGFDAKRDRWNGYDAREYDAVVKEYQETEALREAQIRARATATGTDEALDDNDDARIAEETDMGRSQPTSTRQLRLREDTAAYLQDLSAESAKYDPKTRTMDKTAANLNANPAIAGDEGFVIASHQRQSDPDSDAAAFEKAMRFAWEVSQKPSTPQTALDGQTSTSTDSAQQPHSQPQTGNTKIHLQANPTASLLAHQKHLADQHDQQAARKAYLATKYGHTDASSPSSIRNNSDNSNSQIPSKTPTNSLIPASNEIYTEYDPATGKALPSTKIATESIIPKSKYPEDIFPGNHTSVFGSYWRDGKWGYTCCGSFVRNSYCTGVEGKRAFEEEERQRRGVGLELALEKMQEAEKTVEGRREKKARTEKG